MHKPSPASVMDAQCPSRLVLDRIADKWTALVIQLLSKKTMRYAELHREIGGDFQKKFIPTFGRPERGGFVRSKGFPPGYAAGGDLLPSLGGTLVQPVPG